MEELSVKKEKREELMGGEKQRPLLVPRGGSVIEVAAGSGDE